MGLFDVFNKKTNKEESNTGETKNQRVTFTFHKIPTSVAELAGISESSLDTPFKTAALTLFVLLLWEKDNNTCIDLLNVLKGPAPLGPYELQFLKDRLNGKEYKPRSFFLGATPENNYTPKTPYTIVVEDNPYSYPEANYATLYVKSSGADSLRQIKLRLKPSVNKWYLNDIQCLSDIRIPKDEDPWA